MSPTIEQRNGATIPIRVIEKSLEHLSNPHNERSNIVVGVDRLQRLIADLGKHKDRLQIQTLCGMDASGRLLLASALANIPFTTDGRLAKEAEKDKAARQDCYWLLVDRRCKAEWLTPTVMEIAWQCLETKDLSSLSVMADALQESRCDNEDLLHFSRGATIERMWALYRILFDFVIFPDRQVRFAVPARVKPFDMIEKIRSLSRTAFQYKDYPFDETPLHMSSYIMGILKGTEYSDQDVSCNSIVELSATVPRTNSLQMHMGRQINYLANMNPPRSLPPLWQGILGHSLVYAATGTDLFGAMTVRFEEDVIIAHRGQGYLMNKGQFGSPTYRGGDATLFSACTGLLNTTTKSLF